VIGSNVNSLTFSYFHCPFDVTLPLSSIYTCLPSYYLSDNLTNSVHPPSSKYYKSIIPSSILAAGPDK
jgi:hypothetical protein